MIAEARVECRSLAQALENVLQFVPMAGQHALVLLRLEPRSAVVVLGGSAHVTVADTAQTEQGWQPVECLLDRASAQALATHVREGIDRTARLTFSASSVRVEAGEQEPMNVPITTDDGTMGRRATELKAAQARAGGSPRAVRIDPMTWSSLGRVEAAGHRIARLQSVEGRRSLAVRIGATFQGVIMPLKIVTH
ncbi:hypothetical protein AB0J80_35885 [Actinoplanes sp. NPDC049548]|uniref:hypothetical protein n=1 Tax=Actinoplanes sp. NPDC049548 TaxID=3155152 RepID=UPI00342AC9FD